MAASYQMMFELNAAMGGGFASAFTQGSQQIENMKNKLDALNASGSTGDLLGGISSALSTAGVIKGLEEAYETLQQCVTAASEFETAMASVKRTVGGSDDFISGLGESFKQLSTQMPITSEELANIAATAGQLGIAQQNVESFTTVMAQLATTTDLTADDAATMLAQFANITGTTDYERLGSTVAALGDATATTASKVVQMSQGMAASATQAGMTETDILAISAAVGSLGIEAQAGSTAMSTLISTLYKATETGDKLDQFASVAGMTAEQFKQAWGEDAVGAMNAFIQGLNDTERNGKSAVVILDELGITNVRQTKAILGLASAGDLLTNTISQANTAWSQNTALAEKAGVMYNTTEAKMTMLENSVKNVKIAIGDALTPVVSAVAEGLTALIEPVAEFIEQNPALVQGITAFIAVLGLAAAAIGAYTAITKLAAAANLLFAGSIPGIGIILAVAAGVGALVAGISALVGAINDANPSFETLDAQFDELNEKAKEQQAIIDLAQEYRDLSADIANTEAAIKFKAELDIGDVTPENLKLIDELKGKMENKKASLVQWLGLIGADDISDDDMARLIELAANAQTSDDTLKQELALYTTGDITDDSIATLRSFAEAIVTDSGVLEEELRLIGFDDDTVTSMGYSSYKDFVADVAAGKVVVNADGTITQKLDLGNVAPDDLTLIKEIADNNGYAVTADGKVTQTLDIGGLKEKDLQQLERLKNDVTNAEAKLTQNLELLGVEKITDEKLARFKEIKANTADGTHVLTQLLALEGVENATPYQINQIKEFIKNVQNKEGKVNQKLEAMVKTDQLATMGYATMEEFVAAVNAGEVVINADGTVTQNVDVTGDVAALKEAWENENALAEAEAASTAAADELAAKRERLKTVTDSLRSASEGMITATDEETDALNREIDALDALAQARKNKYSSEALDTIKKQSTQYIQAVTAQEEATARLNRANAQSDVVKTFMATGNAAEYVRGEFESLVEAAQSYEGFNWMAGDDEAAKSLQERFYSLQETINALTGKEYDFFGSGLAGMGTTIEGMNFDILALGDSLGVASDAAIGFGEEVSRNDQIQKEYIQNLIDGIVEGTLKEEELQAALEEAYAGYENGGEIVEKTMEKVREGVEAAKAAAEGSGSTAQSEAETTVQAVGNIITQIEALKKAYDEAKASALSALSGRFGLFDEVGEGAESQTTQQMEANMQAQTNYWDQYNKNLQSALDKGLAPEIAKQLADGSAESAASLATLANASEEEIQSINESFAEVEAMKDTLASTIADMETSFSEGMEALKTELESTVAELDKGSEAAEAAAATMEAYVASLEAAEGDASTQAKAIADAVNAALATIADVDVNINYHENGKPSGNGVEGHDAIGTDYAAAGLTLVGEEGPELVYMNGGEKVLTANETVNALSGSSGGGNTVSVNISPSYNVTGTGSASELKSVLEEQTASLKDMVTEAIEDYITDKMRVSYV